MSACLGLQWGHDKIVMEVTIYGSIRNPPNPLQWGHDKIVMEVEGESADDEKAEKLQWGHDKIVMEVGIIGVALTNSAAGASMGP